MTNFNDIAVSVRTALNVLDDCRDEVVGKEAKSHLYTAMQEITRLQVLDAIEKSEYSGWEQERMKTLIKACKFEI